MGVQCTHLSSPQGGGKYLDRWRKEEEEEGGEPGQLACISEIAHRIYQQTNPLF